jgi:sorting nexin-8
MSLFGDDDVPSRSKQSSGLFDDDQKPAAKSGSGLFDDGFDSNDSPWAFPTPKKAGRGSLVKSLLPASDVPDSYIDAFDALLHAGDRTGNGISVDGATKLLASSGIPTDTQSKILDIVAQPDQDVAGLGRNEFNVLFALVGLAQEGDDVTLDSVDERKRNLPTPSVTLPKSPTSEPSASAPQEQPPPTPPVPQQHSDQPLPSPGRSRAPFRKQSFGDPEADPWGSPDLHKGHNHTNYTPVPVQTNGTTSRHTARTTSQFTTQSTTDQSTPQPAAPPPSSLPSDGGWGGYNGGSGQPFTTPELNSGGFDAPAGGNGGASVPSGLSGSLGRLPGGSGNEEIITITAIAEKEGLFMFQHRNYEVGSNRRANKVVRRYSDFVWLLDCLHKRFPFRQLPLLPPKRVGSEYPSHSRHNVC